LEQIDASLLRPLAPFRQLDAGQIREIIDQAHPLLVPPDHEVFTEAALARRFFLLLDGHVRVERTNAEGDRVVSLHIPPGQLIGIAAAESVTLW
jgi:CRP-like cAMP-binding protein